jgi:SET domain-containing protein
MAAVPQDPNSQRATLETDLVIFRPSSIHGLGGFAKVKIAKGTPILEYLGERITKQESARRCEANNVYIFSLNEHEDIDGNVVWNPARYLNHSCSPNCEAVLESDTIWLVASKDIQAEDEVTFNYGFDLESYREYPCACGSPNCVGFMVAEEFFQHVRNQTTVAAAARAMGAGR